ncbi:M36 family metallopeptidase [Aequorivita capsosiphonis]|uniref:M36 family metallopeptidase n=1 Tax=Aequorivita capsosiphonis TaxID=487317 RepID=UPI000422CF0D|nr:M36 family metallopeptidase [Aequorivita capsosiphonis]
MKKSTLALMVLCFLTIQLSAQDQEREREEKAAQMASKSSTISLEELIKVNNGSYVITNENISRVSEVRNVYLRQAINGLEIYGTESSVHFDKTGKVLVVHNKFLADAPATLKNSSQGITAKQAIVSVANQMGYKVSNLQEIKNIGGKNKSVVFNKANISSEDIPTKLMYYYKEGVGTQLIWELSIAEKTSSDWWNFLVDASTGRILDKDNWTVSCNILGDHRDHLHAASSAAVPFVGPMREPVRNNTEASLSTAPPAASYNVFAMPTENPNYGTRTLVTNPENLLASPYGWHDTNGVEGAEYTNTRGNNADAYDDDNANNNPDGKYAFSPGGNLIFDFPLNLNYSNADQSEDAAVTNLFYWTNILHDVAYQYGFDEVGGNFQHNNYGKGGAGNDPVNAEAQDGSGTCNANFSTPPDGSRPRMQMYVCSDRDGDLDNSVILHEYSHGISIRLTGGPSQVNCLQNQEQMGEGWSDFYGLMLTMEPGDSGADSRGVGTWLIGEGPGGPGIRVHPYSTNFGVNPHTYDNIKTAVAPHGVGEIWATMLWEMTWEIMATESFDPDVYNGTGGNNVALALVTEGLKLQPCSPGFVDGRDAILAADQALYGGAHICAIWEAFARRGLGYSASQGSSGSKSDGTEAFDLPPTFSSLNVVDEVCLADGIQTGLSGGNPEGGVYSGPGVTDDGNGSTFTFDPSVGGEGLVTVTYMVNDFCTGAPTTLTDDIDVTNNPPEIICVGSGLIPMSGSQSSNAGVSIPDGNASGVTVTMDVTENVSITDLDVNVNITHGWVGDLIVKIKSPSGTTATIIDRPGRTSSGYGCSGDDILATLDDEAATPVENECASTTPAIDGTFIPNNPLSVFDGESTLGVWELTVADVAYALTGTLNSWGLDYDYEISAPILDVVLDSNGNATINAEDLLFSASIDCGDYSVLAGDPLAATVSFTCADVGNNTIAVEAKNDNGATATCAAIVNVIGGGGGGTLSCPGDISQDNDPGLCGAEISYIVDSPVGCSGGTLTQTEGLVSGSTFPVGTTTNTFEYDDGVNPVQTCSFDVTINDTELPAAVCQNISVQLDASGNASITVAEVENGSTDNCAIDSMSISSDSFTCDDLGDNDITLTITDVNGNSATCVAVVTVEDTIAPDLTCPVDQTQDPGAGNLYVVPDYFVNGEATATDNCTDPITMTTQVPVAGTELDNGVYTVTLTAEDESGNNTTCTFELTVDITAGIGDHDADFASIQMYPNPTKDKISITNPQQLSLDNLNIYDMRGRLIKTIDMHTMGLEKSIDVSEMASSIYFILIQGNNGQITKKLIKE